MLANEVIGTVGELHPQVAERFAIGKPVTIADLNLSRLLQDAALTKLYGGLPRFPSATRDLALVVPEDLASEQVLHLIRESGGQLLESAHLFDVYRGAQVKEGHKSLAFGLTYRATDRTLTDQEVNTAHQQILERVNQRLGASLR
jgi:phenylalanyl-tRNA synthetase beta chain